MLSFLKRRTPEIVKKLIKNSVQIAQYTWLRFLSYFLFPFQSYQSPLRGYYSSTKDLISDINGDYILLDNSEYITYPSYQKNYLKKSAESDHIDSDFCFISPETFVSIIQNGRVVYDYGVVVSPNHRLVGDYFYLNALGTHTALGELLSQADVLFCKKSSSDKLKLSKKSELSF